MRTTGPLSRGPRSRQWLRRSRPSVRWHASCGRGLINAGGTTLTDNDNDDQENGAIADRKASQTSAKRAPDPGMAAAGPEVGDWLAAWLQAAKSMAKSSPKRCLHLATPGPMVIRVSDIASVRCPACASAQRPANDEMHRCDKCQRVFPGVIKPIEIPLGSLVVEVKLCEDCRNDQLEGQPATAR
jgi:hypothetical protein